VALDGARRHVDRRRGHSGYLLAAVSRGHGENPQKPLR
jgi:hypothetical protein